MTVLGTSVAFIAGFVVLFFVVVIVIFRSMWRVAEPNEALVISGIHHKKTADNIGESMGFKIVTGRGTLVIPGIQVVRRLSLDLREAELEIECVTTQGIPVHIKGVVIYKVGDDLNSIANAARRFLDQQEKMDTRIQNLFSGHLRAIVGGLTVEELIRERDKLTAATRSASGTEMEKLGLIIDSMLIQEIGDPTGYIQNLAMPHAAAVKKDARIAQALADQEATQREQEAAAIKASATRDSSIKQAGYQAEVDQASAQAQQAGPLADATARQRVVVEETKVAELEAAKKEQELQVSVRRPADAAAYEKTVTANAQRDADIAAAEARAKQIELQAQADATRTRLTAVANSEQIKSIGDAEASATRAKGVAEGDAINAKGLAEAAAIAARASALAQNQEAVIGQQLAEQWPKIVEAAAKAYGNVDQMIVLNGAQGMSEMLGQVITQGAAGLQLARNLIGKARSANAPATNGDGATVPSETK
jgi:flotillin